MVFPRLLALASLVLAALVLPSCAASSIPRWFGFSDSDAGNSVATVSAGTDAGFKPRYTTAIYRYLDPTSADIYLTDLPLSRLADAGDTLSDLRGSVLHIHLFLIPEAGSTPIDPTACTAAIQQFVFAGEGSSDESTLTTGAATGKGRVAVLPPVGVYSGGAFVEPYGPGPGKQTLVGTVAGGTVRLVQASGGFSDALGPSTIGGSFSSRLDDAACGALADRLAAIAATIPAYTAPEDPRYAQAILPPVTRASPRTPTPFLEH